MSSSFATKFSNLLRARLNRRSVALAACVALASLFWLLTSLSKEYTDEIRIPVKYNNLPEDALVVNELTTHVSAEVKGFGFNLLWYIFQFDRADITVNANPAILPSYIKNGEKVHYILMSNKGVSLANIKEEQLQIINVSPDTLFVKYKPKFTKMVPIELDADITFEKQFGIVTEPVMEPDSVQLIGVKEEIDTIDQVLTEKQEWNDIDESLSSEIAIAAFENSPLIKVSHATVQVELNVVEFTEGSVDVPLNIVAQKPGSVKVFPSVVEITYQVPLSDYDQVRSDQFQASVILDDAALKQSRLTVNVDRYPVHVKGVRVNPSQVEFIIQK